MGRSLPQSGHLAILPIRCRLQPNPLHLQITDLLLEHIDFFNKFVVRLLHHCQLLLQAVALTSLALGFHVFLADLDLELADVLAVLLQLIFHVHPLLE